jgi:hypothetical protein
MNGVDELGKGSAVGAENSIAPRIARRHDLKESKSAAGKAGPASHALFWAVQCLMSILSRSKRRINITLRVRVQRVLDELAESKVETRP